jgi:hypothetical protein
MEAVISPSDPIASMYILHIPPDLKHLVEGRKLPTGGRNRREEEDGVDRHWQMKPGVHGRPPPRVDEGMVNP